MTGKVLIATALTFAIVALIIAGDILSKKPSKANNTIFVAILGIITVVGFVIAIYNA